MDTETVKLTIRLPKHHVVFVKSYAAAHGLTVTEVIDRYLRRIRAFEHLSPTPELEKITGLIPADINAEGEYRDHLKKKHSR